MWDDVINHGRGQDCSLIRVCSRAMMKERFLTGGGLTCLTLMAIPSDGDLIRYTKYSKDLHLREKEKKVVRKARNLMYKI